MKVFKVLIVDDNSYVVEALSTTIKWSSLECNIIGLATNGLEGNRLIKSKKPDIILTDIKMPGQDGLSMLESTKRFSPSSRIIVISAYQEFDFAKRAISLNVVDYLTKPIDKMQLLKAIKKAVNILRKEQLQSKKVEQIDQDFQIYLKLKQEKCILDLLNFKFPSIEAVIEHFRNADLHFTSFIYIAVQVNSKIKPTIEVTNRLQDDLRGDLQQRILCTFIDDKFIIWVFYNKRITYSSAIRTIRPLLKNILDMQSNKYVLQYVISPNLYKSFADIPRAYEESSKMLLKAAFGMTASETKSLVGPNGNSLATQAIFEKYSNMLSSGEVGAEHIMQELIKKVSENFEYDDFVIKSVLIQFIGYHINRIYRKHNNINIDVHAVMNKIKEIQNIDQAQKCLCEILANISNRISSHNVQFSLIVQKSIKYIFQNAQSDISLGTLSETLSVSPTYLSTIIKKETGKNFREILVTERIEIAKKLLKNPDYSIENVANAVCYKNYISFYKVFKKITGMSPTEYRNGNYNYVLLESLGE